MEGSKEEAGEQMRDKSFIWFVAGATLATYLSFIGEYHIAIPVVSVSVITVRSMRTRFLAIVALLWAGAILYYDISLKNMLLKEVFVVVFLAAGLYVIFKKIPE
jgi:hypothetical protein